MMNVTHAVQAHYDPPFQVKVYPVYLVDKNVFMSDTEAYAADDVVAFVPYGKFVFMVIQLAIQVDTLRPMDNPAHAKHILFRLGITEQKAWQEYETVNAVTESAQPVIANSNTDTEQVARNAVVIPEPAEIPSDPNAVAEAEKHAWDEYGTQKHPLELTPDDISRMSYQELKDAMQRLDNVDGYKGDIN